MLRRQPKPTRTRLWWPVVPAVLCLTAAFVWPAAAGATARPGGSPASPNQINGCQQPRSLGSGLHALRVDGATWDLSVVATSCGTTTVEVSLSRYTAAGGEDHTWGVGDLPGSSLTVSGATWKLDPPSADTAPLLSLDVSFHSARSSKTACMTTDTGTLSGTVKVATGLAKAGTVGGTALSFGSESTATVDTPCTPPKQRCIDGSVFGITPQPSSAPSATGFSQGAKGDDLGIVKFTQLAKPKAANRTDEVVVTEPAITVRGTTVTVKTKGSLVTGGATFTVSGASTSTVPCTLSGVAHTETTKSYAKGTTTALSLVGHSTLSGALTVSKTHDSDFLTVESY